MPSRKQRRRRQKTRRHEWEYVYVDEEGHEVEVDSADVEPGKNGKAAPRPERRPARGQAARPGRTVQPPSWNRVMKRALFVGPAVIIAMLLLNRNASVAARVLPALVLLVFFLPFSYLTDSLAYRMYKKRAGDDAASARRR